MLQSLVPVTQDLSIYPQKMLVISYNVHFPINITASEVQESVFCTLLVLRLVHLTGNKIVFGVEK